MMESKVDKVINAVDLLKEELEKEHSPMVPAIPIINHLISRCEGDEAFSERVVLENKSLEECLKYVLQEVKKKLDGKNGCIPDQEVYDMAETYYTLDKVEIEKPKARTIDIPQRKANNISVQAKKSKPIEKEQMSLFEF